MARPAAKHPTSSFKTPRKVITMHVSTSRIVRCRVLDKRSNPCTGEAVVPDAPLLICQKHLGEAMRLVAEVQAAAAKARVEVA